MDGKPISICGAQKRYAPSERLSRSTPDTLADIFVGAPDGLRLHVREYGSLAPHFRSFACRGSRARSRISTRWRPR